VFFPPNDQIKNIVIAKPAFSQAQRRDAGCGDLPAGKGQLVTEVEIASQNSCKMHRNFTPEDMSFFSFSLQGEGGDEGLFFHRIFLSNHLSLSVFICGLYSRLGECFSHPTIF
jgi:hypothetical protein